jgi:hypothetical protein
MGGSSHWVYSSGETGDRQLYRFQTSMPLYQSNGRLSRRVRCANTLPYDGGRLWQWRNTGAWRRCTRRRAAPRQHAGRRLLQCRHHRHSQSVKTTLIKGAARLRRRAAKVKRPEAAYRGVDTQGLPPPVKIHPANPQDHRDGAVLVLSDSAGIAFPQQARHLGRCGLSQAREMGDGNAMGWSLIVKHWWTGRTGLVGLGRPELPPSRPGLCCCPEPLAVGVHLPGLDHHTGGAPAAQATHCPTTAACLPEK